MAFKKSKKTFGESAGRMGMPSARKPMMTSEDREEMAEGGHMTAKKTSKKGLTGKKSSFRISKKPVTGPLKGKIASFKTAKKPKTPKRMRQDLKNSNFYMSKRPKGSSPAQDSIDKRLGSYFSGIKGGF